MILISVSIFIFTATAITAAATTTTIVVTLEGSGEYGSPRYSWPRDSADAGGWRG